METALRFLVQQVEFLINFAVKGLVGVSGLEKIPSWMEVLFFIRSECDSVITLKAHCRLVHMLTT